jgi:hypothetical protein
MFASIFNIDCEFGESPRRLVARRLRESHLAFVGDSVVRGHSFQIGATAAFWTPKAQDGTNVFRARWFRRCAATHLPKSDAFTFLSSAPLTNDKLRRETSLTRRRLSHLRAGPGQGLASPKSQSAQTSLAHLAHLPDRYGRRIG